MEQGDTNDMAADWQRIRSAGGTPPTSPQRWFDLEGNQISRAQADALGREIGDREITKSNVGDIQVVTSWVGHDYTNEMDRPYNFEMVVGKREVDKFGVDVIKDERLMDFFPNKKEALAAHAHVVEALEHGHAPEEIDTRAAERFDLEKWRADGRAYAAAHPNELRDFIARMHPGGSEPENALETELPAVMSQRRDREMNNLIKSIAKPRQASDDRGIGR